jgi:predicted transcriptional regulator
MPTITVKLDQKRADELARWARSRKMTKSEAVRELIDRKAKIETGDDLIRLFEACPGQGLGLHLKDS